MAKLKGMRDICWDGCFSECEIVTLGEVMNANHFHK